MALGGSTLCPTSGLRFNKDGKKKRTHLLILKECKDTCPRPSRSGHMLLNDRQAVNRGRRPGWGIRRDTWSPSVALRTVVRTLGTLSEYMQIRTH